MTRGATSAAVHAEGSNRTLPPLPDSLTEIWVGTNGPERWPGGGFGGITSILRYVTVDKSVTRGITLYDANGSLIRAFHTHALDLMV